MSAPATQVWRPSRRRRWARRLRRNGWNALAFLTLLLLLSPIYFMVKTAFTSTDALLTSGPTIVPGRPVLEHFRRALERPGFWDGVKNSVLISSGTVVICLVLAFLAAVALARFRFTGRRVFLVLMLGVQMIPVPALLIPLYYILSRPVPVVGESLVHSHARIALVAAYLAFVLPFAVWMLRGFISGIPPELEEAAMVDGCTQLGAFRRILLPLVMPGLVATSVFAFITSWNEFLFAYIFLSKDQDRTLTIWLAYFYGSSRFVDWGDVMAASVLTALPVVVFFLAVQRKIAFGLTAGAVKG